jgi:uncharacterized membrane protein HdeD (DUF308 family)
VEDVLARNWGMVVLRGVLALGFGVIALWYPQLTLTTLVLLFGAYALMDGVSAVVSAIARRRGERHWIPLLVGGLAGVALGVGTFVMPSVTATVLLYLIAAWAVVTGVAQIVTGVKLRRIIRGEWLLIVAGALAVMLGLFLASRPDVGALALVLWIGAYAVATGLVLMALGFRLRAWGRTDQVDSRPIRAAG